MGSNAGPAPEAAASLKPAVDFGTMAETLLFGVLFFPVKVCEKTGIASLFPGLSESQRTAAEGKHRDGAARFWQVDGRQSRGRSQLCDQRHRQGSQVPLAASETSVLSCHRVV